MSISLLISAEHIPQEKWKSLPVASEDAFNNLWLPLIEDSEFVPLFEVGLDVNNDNLGDVLRELENLEAKMNILSKQDAKYGKPLERIRELLKTLPDVVSKYSQVFIG